MKKLLFLLVCALLLLLASAAPALANHSHKGPLLSTAELTFIVTDPETEDGYWSGSITGGVRGAMQMNGLDVYESRRGPVRLHVHRALHDHHPLRCHRGVRPRHHARHGVLVLRLGDQCDGAMEQDARVDGVSGRRGRGV